MLMPGPGKLAVGHGPSGPRCSNATAMNQLVKLKVEGSSKMIVL